MSIEDISAHRLRIFDSLLARFPVGRLVDLGTGHGIFARRSANAGWQVTAIDARAERFPDDDRIDWRVDDVRSCPLTEFDLIVNLGLLYHLDVETQLSLLDRSRGIPIILDTHVGNQDEKGFDLSAMTTQAGYEGRLYSEAGIQHDPRSSFGNLQSFWPTRESLLRMLNDRGWDVLVSEPWYMPSRTFFLCLPK